MRCEPIAAMTKPWAARDLRIREQYCSVHASHPKRAKPYSSTPHSRNLSAHFVDHRHQSSYGRSSPTLAMM